MTTIPCILIPFLVGLICALLGYLLGRLFSKNNTNVISNDLQLDYDNCMKSSSDLKNRIYQLEQELALSKQNVNLNSSNEVNNISRISNESNQNALNYKDEYDNCMKSSSDLKNRISQLEEELALCKQSINLNSTNSVDSTSRISNDTVNITPEIPFNTDLASTVFGKKIKQDDLKIVEGIGPKIEELYHSFNIKTWKQLSETSVEKSNEILESGGDRFKLHTPNTWAKQAKLCYEGKWEELKKLQDELDGGKE